MIHSMGSKNKSLLWDTIINVFMFCILSFYNIKIIKEWEIKHRASMCKKVAGLMQFCHVGEKLFASLDWMERQTPARTCQHSFIALAENVTPCWHLYLQSSSWLAAG